MLDTGGVSDSLKTLGTFGGAALGGAAGLASSIGNPNLGQSDVMQAALGAGIGGMVGRAAGGAASRAIHNLNKRYSQAERITGIPRSKLEELPLASRLNLLHHADKEIQLERRKTGEEVPDAVCKTCSKPESSCTCPPGTDVCPTCTVEEMKSAAHKQTERERISKILNTRQRPLLRSVVGAGLGGLAMGALGGMQEISRNGGPWTPDFDPERGAVGAAVGVVGGGTLGYLGARQHNQLVDMPPAEKKRLERAAVTLNAIVAKHAYQVEPADYSATQLREYQLKNLEPRMGHVMNAIGAVSGGLLGGAIGGQIDHPLIGAAAGAGAGAFAAMQARRLASNAIQKRYLTRRVMEEAGYAPLSQQVQKLRSTPASVVTGTERLVNVPGQKQIRITSNPVVDAV
jgi:uncharacterized protein YcfJ